MKKYILSALFIGFCAFSANAQVNENEKAQAELDAKGHFGHFNYRFDEIHTINVNYAVTPKVATEKLNFTLHTPEPRPLSVAIINASGLKVKEWNPTQDSYIKEGEIDVKSLPAGNYKFVILWDKKKAHEIAFEKK